MNLIIFILFRKYFQGAILPDGTYKTLNPVDVVDAQF